MEDVGSELEALDAEDGTPAPETPPQKPAVKPPARPGQKPPEGTKPAETPPADGKGTKPADVPAEPVKVADLRAAYKGLKEKEETEYKPLAAEVTQLRAKVKELESGGGVDAKTLTERATKAEARVAELEGAIKFADYRKSREFIDKYQKPYAEAWTRAVHDFEQLTVDVPTGEVDQGTGQPLTVRRKATAQDLLRLANMELSEMDEQAETMFGRSAARVIRHVEKVRELSDAMTQALEEAEKSTKERESKLSTELEQRREFGRKVWTETNTELATKYPNWFAPAEGDQEGNDLLAKGFAFADRLFSPTPETAPKTPIASVRLQAIIRNKAANHDRLALRVKKATARIKELETALKEYEDSGPPAPGGGAPGDRGGNGADWRKSDEAEIDALDER